MKKLFCILFLCFIVTGVGFSTPVIPKKQNLKVLYVGYRPDLPLPDYATLRRSAESQAGYETRMGAFKAMLANYFTCVETVDVRDYQEVMSEDYDVTIFDGLPEPIEKAVVAKDPMFDILTILKKHGVYLTENFDRPAIFVGYVADEIGHSLGLKLDWYCLCLFYHALNIRTEHPIFHKPFDVKITLEKRQTPEDFYNYNQDWVLPREIPMWRVEKDSSDIGMVSGWYGLQEGNDAEYISGGHCMKSYENMAIGRHGNFFMWGFGAAPGRMTPEARTVFANAVCYISRFGGKKPVVRKFNYPVLREKIENFLTIMTPEGYQLYLKGVDTYNCWLAEKQKALHMQKGKLSEEDRKLLERKPMESLSHLEYVKRNSQFGLIYDYNMNIEACRKFLTENMEYFYGGHDRKCELDVDEDVKSLGIPNRDKRLLDVCIRMLENKQDRAKALRILKRYTHQDYLTAAEWRNWLNTYCDKLFFTELGDYKYMGDGSVCINYEDQQTREEERPVVITTELSGEGREREIKIKFKIQQGYHIYASGGADCPMVMTKVSLQLPEGVKPEGKMSCPPAENYAADGKVKIYKGEVEFSQKIKVAETGAVNKKIVCIIDYQCCNAEICLNPQQERHEISVSENE